MRKPLIAFMTLLSLAGIAAAHGGGSFRGPNSGRWLRGIPCTCAKVECEACAADGLRPAAELAVRHEVVELQRWADVARCRITVSLASPRARERTEGWISLTPAPVFAAVKGRIDGEAHLAASLRPSLDARSRYLWEKRRFRRDPLLVLRRGPGRVDARAFPIGAETPAVLQVEGFLLAPPVGPAARDTVRLYRTNDRYLAVVSGAAAPADASFVEQESGRITRALIFLTGDECARRFGPRPVEQVPFVEPLETAVTGVGRAAAGYERVLAALPAEAQLPPFVGPDRWQPGAVPPGVRGAEGEPPPPPPPTPEEEAATAGAAREGRGARPAAAPARTRDAARPPRAS